MLNVRIPFYFFFSLYIKNLIPSGFPLVQADFGIDYVEGWSIMTQNYIMKLQDNDISHTKKTKTAQHFINACTLQAAAFMSASK